MKNLILVAVLLLIVSSLSFGQSASANVTATVQATLTIIKTNDLALGIVTRGNAVTVPSTDAAAAAFTITGIATSQATVTISSLANLTSGSYTMPFTQQTPIYNTTNSQSGTTDFGALTGGIASTNSDGNLWVWFGGRVTASVGQAAGLYSGTINVSVTQP
jgi:hypothetical protein